MVLGDVEESVTTREIDEETEEEIVKVRTATATYVLPSTYLLSLLSHHHCSPACRHRSAAWRCFSSEEI
jgi:hypothetical protein